MKSYAVTSPYEGRWVAVELGCELNLPENVIESLVATVVFKGDDDSVFQDITGRDYPIYCGGRITTSGIHSAVEDLREFLKRSV